MAPPLERGGIDGTRIVGGELEVGHARIFVDGESSGRCRVEDDRIRIGITVYEGTLLPELFHNQIIHCDAGPRVVRAYIAKADGAGYSATIKNILNNKTYAGRIVHNGMETKGP